MSRELVTTADGQPLAVVTIPDAAPITRYGITWERPRASGIQVGLRRTLVQIPHRNGRTLALELWARAQRERLAPAWWTRWVRL